MIYLSADGDERHLVEKNNACPSFLRRIGIGMLGIATITVLSGRGGGAERAPITFHGPADGQLQISIDGEPFATYVFADPKIPRPYFCHVRAPGGIQVTRNHPPIPGQDATDHETLHPGVWMAFGDLAGADSWRLKAPVRHREFTLQPSAAADRAAFAVTNDYHAQEGSTTIVCREAAHYTISVSPAGYLLTWDSTFNSEREFAFGDQEEMGLGIRVASPLRVQGGNGRILDALGYRNGAEVRGSNAAWCDYSGMIDGRWVGMTIFCHPNNFRPSWYHARDYGFVAANPFGRGALERGEPSRVVVKPGESLRLRYAILVHAHRPDARPNLDVAFEDYVGFAGE